MALPRTRVLQHSRQVFRQRTHRHVSALALVLLVVLAMLAACGSNGSGSGSSSGPQKGGTLTVGLNSDVITLDPLKSTSLYDREVMLNIYDTLVTTDNQNNVKPDLATSWTFPSPTTVVFTLHSGIKFQDGTPFNAQAVVYNINRILNTPSSPRYSELATVQSVQAVDDMHVQFNLKKPFTPLLATLADRAGMILSPTALQASGADIANNPKNAGTGPFIFDTWVKGDHLTIKRNPNYWQKDSSGNALPYLDTITYKPITNESVLYTNLETSSVNVAEALAPINISAAKSNPNLVYKQIPGLGFDGFMLNTKAAPFTDVHARQAVAWAVNRQEILSSVLHNVGVLSNGPIPPSSWAYDSSFKPFTADVSKAKAEVAQTSTPSGFSFTLLVASGSPLDAQMAQYIQSELQPAGITVNIKQETFATIESDTAAHNFQAALVSWSGRPDPDGNLYNWFHTGGGFNDMQYSNPQVDALLQDARVQTDQSKRASDYQQAQKLIVEDAPYIFIYHNVAQQASTKNVQNFPLAPTTIMNFTQTYLGA